MNLVNRKSQEGIILSLYQSLFEGDLPRMHGKPAEFARDLETITRRTRNEGMSFLTKTLPKLGKAIDYALQGDGRLLITDFPKRHKVVRGKHVHYALPKFMWVLLSRVFNPFTGHILGRPNVCAVNDLRQVCYLAYKLELPYDEQTVKDVLNKFVAVDLELPMEFEFKKGTIYDRALTAGNELLRSLLGDFDIHEIIPGHGPGVVATGEKPWQKFNFTKVYRQIARVFPYGEYFHASPSHYSAYLLDANQRLKPLDEGQAKVMLVPKDSRGPRLISAEPLDYQFIQQGLSRSLVKLVERHPLSRERVNFTCQEINRTLALQGSRWGEFHTLDMSEASDRVSMALVERLFASLPLLLALKATRTPETLLPDGRVVRFRKFAPMGSALCFPVEALCFWALGAGLLHVILGLPLKKAARSIYVYGDDIIVREEFSLLLREHFPSFHLKFNEGKCCITGNFRESCGCDAFLGEDVTPVKLKKLLPTSRSRDASPFLSIIEQSNALWRKGFYSTSETLKVHVEQLYGPIPLKQNFSEEGDLVPSWYHRFHRVEFKLTTHKRRWNKNLQRFEFLVLVSSATVVKRNSRNWRELFRWLVSPTIWKACIYTIPRRVEIKRRWRALR